MRTRLPATVPLLFGLAAACDDAAPPAHGVVRDSAGIGIVEHEAGERPPEWSLGETTIALGAIDAGEAYELYQPLHALRLDDGRVVVANQGTEELRFFGADGLHLRTVGRTGGGPGEFRDMWGLVRLPGDSLGVWDWTAKRLTVYDDAGSFARVVTAAADVGQFAPRLLGVLDGTFVLLRGFDPMSVFGSGGGLRQDSVRLLRLAIRDGALVDSLGPYPGAERYVRMGEGAFWMRGTKFGREEHVGVGGGRIALGDDRKGEIRVYAPDGTLLRIIRLDHASAPVTHEHTARYDEQHLEEVAADRLAEERRRLAELPAADRLPAFRDLFADRLGRLWIEAFDIEAGTPDSWTILDPDGRLLGRLRLPPGARPLDAGEDYVLLYDRDVLRLEHVSLHPLRTETPS
ncbi:MAG TPA: hypothetical protein VMM12_13715 [Longimicrobiales bacterium]|nr:hypothetical protein [Longimicrobiales bacterium]